MHASKNISLMPLLSLLVMALVLTAPSAFAKKDLFANDPAGNQSSQVQNLVTTSSSAAADIKNEEPVVVADEPKAEEADDEKPSYIETQLTRLKGHLVEVKEDLFGSKKSSKKITPDTKAAAEQSLVDNAHAEEVQPELPTISATEAAQRAQNFAEGQVINVRKYQEEDKPRYAVKLLQKNGRMKTINLNAVSGELIEETIE
ncbi:MAG: hypothetical protein EOO53_07385 [Gammaproteobacteria bacterium]|nr:MAG: hypothetical protein EOO53_07385 [Gammaproteobacteria bacterium]